MAAQGTGRVERRRRGRLPRTARVALLGPLLALAVNACTAAAELPLHRLALPEGFAVSIFARVPGARSMAIAGDTVYVGTRGSTVYAATDANRDGHAEFVRSVMGGLKVPNGVAWRDGHLYVAEQHRIIRVPAPAPDHLGTGEVLFDGLPDKRWHGWRYAAFGPDGALYVSVGSPCNICRVSGLEGTILRLAAPDWRPEVYASGIRNSVGFDFQPGTGILFFTDNGADWMGDDSPPDELNRAPEPGLHFGYPYFGGGQDRTLDFRGQEPPPNQPPEVAFNAHVAALGVHFYRGTRFPADYRGDAIVAQHGSWNRSVPDGYRLMRVRFRDGRAQSRQVFVDGWLHGGTAWGRPVDVKELEDGSLLVSDDHAGVIYRITYR